jgi:pectin methylesterase-like acyl-CoA thioesterase
MNPKPFCLKTLPVLCLMLRLGSTDAKASLYDIFYKVTTAGALNPLPARIGPPGNFSCSAAAPVSGTNWNQVSQNTGLNLTGLAAGTYTYSANNQAAGGWVWDAASNKLSGVTLTITYTNNSSGNTRTEPSNGSGENTIQPGGVTQYSFRGYYGGGNGFIYAFAGLPASTSFDLYAYTGTGSGAGLSLSLLPAYALGANTANALLLNGLANSAGNYGSIWTGISPNYTLLVISNTWMVLHGQTDGSGTFAFKHNGGSFSGSSSSYLSGFQLVQVPVSTYSVTGGGSNCTSVVVGLSGSQTGVSYQLMNGSTSVGSPVPGTGSAISFGGQTSSGTCTVVGRMTDGTSLGASATMTGSVAVTINPATSVSAASPASQTTTVGATISISVTGGGTTPLAYVWEKDGVTLSNGLQASGSTILGSTTANLQISSVQLGDSAVTGQGYTCTVSGGCGSPATSAEATLSVTTSDTPPTFSGPTNQTIVAGNNATLSATVTGGFPLPGLQWYLSTDGGVTSNGIAGAASSTLMVTDIQYSQNNYQYSLLATNDAGTNASSMTLTVVVTANIGAQPTNQVVLNGNSASFSVTAGGVPAPSYQWYFTNSPIVGATGASYAIASAAPANMGGYFVVVSNSVNSVTSSVATLTVNSTTISLASLAPSNGAVKICYDTPLHVTFNQTPVLKTSGKIRIYNVTNSVNPVETIDLSLSAANGTQARSNYPGDSTPFNYFPVVITGATAAIYLRSASGLLTSNQTYYVTVDDGVFADATGAFFAGITATNAWQFSTKMGGPVDPVNPVVNFDGSGDFDTVQGAVDSLALNANGARRTVRVKNGTYFELVNISGKTNLTVLGQNRFATVIQYLNNVNTAANGGAIAGRMSFKINANDVALDNLTQTNTTPQGGGQAEALNTSGSHTIVNNSVIASRQDTLLPGQVFFYNSRILGNFDYIWGGGTLYFYKCVFHTLSGAQNLTAARTATSGSLSSATPWINPNGTTYSANGFSFVNCLFEADSGLTGVTLADSNGSNGGLDCWAFCKFDTTAYITPSVTLSNAYIFWQYQNTDTNGVNPASFSNLQTIGVTNNDLRLLAVTNITTWLGGWTPLLLPNITTNPVPQSASQGQPVNFTVSATGIPDPAYQWLSNSVPISGATNATLRINGAVRADAASYSVIVSNTSGSVTSSVAALTYTGNVAPVAGTTFALGVVTGIPSTVQIVGGKYPPTDADGDALTISNPSATNGTVTTDGTNITYTATNGTNDTIIYTISDDYGGTAAGAVNVAVATSAGYNQMSAQLSGGQEALNYYGVPWDNYALEWTHDLTPPVNWVPLQTNMAGPNGGLWFTNPASGGMDFYRTRDVQ